MNPSQSSTSKDPLRRLEQIEKVLHRLPKSRRGFSAARKTLRELAAAARDTACREVEQFLQMISALLEVVEAELDGGNHGSPSPLAEEMLSFLRGGTEPLRCAWGGKEGDPDTEELQQLLRQAREQWGEYLSLFDTPPAEPEENDLWDEILTASAVEEPPAEMPPVNTAETQAGREEVQRILQALQNEVAQSPAAAPSGSGVSSANETAEKQKAGHVQKAGSAVASSRHLFETTEAPPAEPPAPVAPEMDTELKEAFLEDATGGANRLEQLILALEGEERPADAGRLICRELHTLKGASASVGLTALAGYLHAVEDEVERQEEGALSVPDLLRCVDAVRAQMAALSGGSRPIDSGANMPVLSPHSTLSPDSTAGVDGSLLSGAMATRPAGGLPAASSSTGTAGEETLRVQASRVDRLLDLLAELVSLRNQRDTRLSHLKTMRSELSRCAMRLRILTTNRMPSLSMASAAGWSDPETFPADANTFYAASGVSGGAKTDQPGGLLTTIFTGGDITTGSAAEIVNDIGELTRELDGMIEPVEAENEAISRFIRQFRQELLEMRRLSVAGLFQRLQRAAQDAARSEGRRVRFQFAGAHAGLDRSLQERLYEPLLHLVRNAVSHGVETPGERLRAGKPETGTVVISAKGNPSTLVLEVTDDGRGLDYESIRRRGQERGLIPPGEDWPEWQLARLIFHPGFSTRDEVNGVSGRGVGLDVVAASLQRMRARIDVESQPGQGTLMRLTIPLRSVIEHVMTIRIAGQLYAVPLAFVREAGPSAESEQPSAQDRQTAVWLRQWFGLPPADETIQQQVVVLGEGELSLAATGTKAGQQKDDCPSRCCLRLVVDGIVGPEEIVVRSLPPLLKSHPLLAGISLSGGGEIVLLLDAQRLLQEATSADRRIDSSILPTAAENVPAETGNDSLPATSAAQGDSARKASVLRHVLVIDDSLSARRRLVGFLKQAGLQADEAGDGREGLRCLRGRNYDAVFTDIEMPHMDGLELLEEIRQPGQWAALPVVVVSSRTEDEFRNRARQLSAAACLAKPVNEEELNNVLAQLQRKQHNQKSQQDNGTKRIRGKSAHREEEGTG